MSELLPLDQSGTATISPCGRYRYLLTRTVGRWGRSACFIMLNPSTADATQDDPTIRRCVAFCRRWQCGELLVVNLFAVRGTHPDLVLREGVPDPVGPDNHRWVSWATNRAARSSSPGPVVCAWGQRGSFMDQDRTVLGWLDAACIEPVALKVSPSTGQPWHPLYVAGSAELQPFRGRP